MKVLVGFSGGVDSAVTAALLRRDGHEVCGLYLDNAGEAERSDAELAAEAVGIPLQIRDVKSELEEKVCRPFTDCYLRGETPNPCILCNPSMKFRNLLAAADALGAERIATGHYARAAAGALFKGHPANDQSYMLCRLTRAQAARLLLPLGGYEKKQVRALAEDFGLPVAHKPDSMEICFIPDKDYVGWLGRRAVLPGPGNFVLHGEVIGIDAAKNEIELALWEELFKTEVTARDFNWLCEPPAEPFRATVRVRHTKWENPPCTVRVEGDRVLIRCDEPVRAPAAGQSAVLYDGDRLLGGGFIVQE